MLHPGPEELAAYAALHVAGAGIGLDEADLYGATPEDHGLGAPLAARPGPIGAVIAGALETFTDVGSAVSWLRLPHPMLDGQAPLLAAATEEGARRAMELLDLTRREQVT
jgi:hypothetical protein